MESLIRNRSKIGRKVNCSFLGAVAIAAVTACLLSSCTTIALKQGTPPTSPAQTVPPATQAQTTTEAAQTTTEAAQTTTEAAPTSPDQVLTSKRLLPPKGFDYLLAWDSTRGQVIMFGPCDLGWPHTWAYDPGSNIWSNLNLPARTPPGRQNAGIVYVPSTRKVIMFGGLASATNGQGLVNLDDIWAYDPATNTWTELHPSGSRPPARFGASMVYEPSTHRVLLFGGTVHENGTATDLSDVWAYDPAANTWTEVAVAGPMPPERTQEAVVYDPSTSRVILFGGWSSRYHRLLNDIWAYDLAANTWTELHPSGAPPSASDCAWLSYDPGTKRLIVFEESVQQNPLRKIWAYDPAANTWTDLGAPASLPPARDLPARTCDSSTGRVILFGGAGFNDTWAYDPAANTWRNLDPSGTEAPFGSTSATGSAVSTSVTTGTSVNPQDEKAATEAGARLYPVELNGKFGFVDKTGKLVIPARYDDAQSFSAGLAAVEVNGEYGYIDPSGAMVIQPQFDNTSGFFGDLAWVVGGDTGLGYIDRTGKLAIGGARYEADFWSFSEELAGVLVDGVFCYVDEHGKVVIKTDYAGGFMFSEGLAAVFTDDERMVGFIDKSGRLAIRFGQGGQALPYAFTEGLAAVLLDDKWGFIDKSGALVIPARFENAFQFTGGLAAVVVDGKYGFINKKGDLVIPAKYDEATYFREGLAPVELGGKWGFIDTSGRVVVPLQYAGALWFTNGLAPVEVGEKWGFIDTKGTMVIQPRFDSAGPSAPWDWSRTLWLMLNGSGFGNATRSAGP